MKKITVLSILCLLLVIGCGSGKPRTQSGIPVSAQNNVAGTLSVKISAGPEETARADNKAAVSSGNVIEIKEKMFIAQTNDVYLNPDDYLGRTIKLEGLFKREAYGEQAYCFVLRYGPGCCGTDGNAGFEVAWDETAEVDTTAPAVDDWVEATGVLKSYEEDGYPYLYIALSGLTVLDKRGAEFVTQ